MSALRIYFAAGLRAGADFALLERRIAMLSTIGEVTTRHMATPATADLGHRDDAAIFAHDQELLARSDIFVGDLASPSTGAGFMAARAIGRGMPALCLYREGQKPSAMIAGCPQIATAFYASDAEAARRVRDFVTASPLASRAFRPRRLFLAGPPGSGKGTLAASLASLTGAAHLSTGELLRDLVKRGEHPHAERIAGYMNAGQLVPAELMAELVVERMRAPECEKYGVILDGYPPSEADLANLRTAGIEPDLTLYLECSDATAVARQIHRGARSTDTPDKARDRIATFHEADLSFVTLAARWFPDSIVVRIDAEQGRTAVDDTARDCVVNMFGDPRRDRSYFPLLPRRASDVRSTRVHFHVDAPDVYALRAIAADIYARAKWAQGQIKIYPIQSLHLGAQTRLPIYRRLPNFHTIQNAETEAFITGRMGDGDDELMEIVLDAVRDHAGPGAAKRRPPYNDPGASPGVMTELESYVGEWTLRGDGALREDAIYAPLPTPAFDEFTEYLASDVPAWELHLGFDLPRDGGGLPISLEELTTACAARGLDNGGWFLFKHAHHAYRSNEFSSLPQPAARDLLFSQARALRDLLAAKGITAEIGFSLERVHGIWTMPG